MCIITLNKNVLKQFILKIKNMYNRKIFLPKWILWESVTGYNQSLIVEIFFHETNFKSILH